MANVSVVQELGYVQIFMLLGAFGQKIQGGFGHFSGRNWTLGGGGV